MLQNPRSKLAAWSKMHKDVLAGSHFEGDFGKHFISFPDFLWQNMLLYRNTLPKMCRLSYKLWTTKSFGKNPARGKFVWKLVCPLRVNVSFRQRFSRHPFVCAVWPFRTACVMNGNKKILVGHLPVIPRPRFLHHGFRQPLALCMRKKKTSKSVSVRELEPFQNFTIPLRNLQFHCKYVSLWEGLSEHGGLSPLRGPTAGAISGLQPSSLRGERRSIG